MKRVRKRSAAVAMMLVGVMTVGTGIALEGVASAHPEFNQAEWDFHLKDQAPGDHHGAEWADFKGDAGDCDNAQVVQGLPYGWHFVIPGNAQDTGDLTQVQAHFSTDGTITGGHVVQSGKGWYLYTATADTLLDAVGEGTIDHEPNPLVMNLSHTCGPDGNNSSSSSSSTTSSSEESSSEESSSQQSSSQESSSEESSSQQSSSEESSSQQSSSQESSSQESSSVQSSSTSRTTSTIRTSSSQTTTSSSQESSSEETSSSAESSVLNSSLVQSSEVETSSEETSSVVATGTDQQSPTAVRGVQVTRQLPRTGVDPGLLLMIGGLTILSGVLMLRYADR